MLPWNKVFALQLFAGAGCESHTEMRQAFVPWAKYAHLLCTIFRRQFCNRMQIPRCRFRAKQIGRSLKWLSSVDAAFDPNFINKLLLPIGEQADAIATGLDRIEVFCQLAEGEVLV